MSDLGVLLFERGSEGVDSHWRGGLSRERQSFVNRLLIERGEDVRRDPPAQVDWHVARSE
jgi:hypothetical protein